MNENETLQIRVMGSNKKSIIKTIKILQKVFPDSVFTGIYENTLRKEGFKWRGYLIVNLTKEVKKKHGLD
jgi:hypothetical protein